MSHDIKCLYPKKKDGTQENCIAKKQRMDIVSLPMLPVHILISSCANNENATLISEIFQGKDKFIRIFL